MYVFCFKDLHNTEGTVMADAEEGGGEVRDLLI
jgi:hypothetical protein